VLAHRQHDVLRNGQRREQRALLKKYADERRLFSRADLCDRFAVDQHLSSIRLVQSGQRLEEHGLAGAGTSGNPEDLSALDIEIDPVVHMLPAKPVDDAACGHDGVGRSRGNHDHRPSFSNRSKTARPAR
jgi:hypothetical protein